MSDIQPECHYRVSVKALILNKSRDGFLITQEAHGWDIPGGGLEHEEDPRIALAREIREEMFLQTTYIAASSCYFVTARATLFPIYIANVVYETTLEHLEFTKTPECLDIAFLTKENASDFTLTENAQALLEIFDPGKH
jgi:8-oxo-dGTP pyrophosphatase MutT (NUDIX family)